MLAAKLTKSAKIVEAHFSLADFSVEDLWTGTTDYRYII